MNWSKSKLYLIGVVCLLVAAVAYAVYIDSRVSKLEKPKPVKNSFSLFF